MKSITFAEAAAFQEIFWNGDHYSPYEFVSDIGNYFALTILGELGTLLNAVAKQERSPNDYAREIENDAADIVICLLIYALWLEKREGVSLKGVFQKEWKTKPQRIKNHAEFLVASVSLTTLVSKLARTHSEALFLKTFRLSKAIGMYASHKSWQEICNQFHSFTLDKITQFDRYTPDLWYRGSCYVNFDKLNAWIGRTGAQLPRKRKYFLERMAHIQRSVQ